ncbi:MAG: nucleoside deaminase [Salinibacterium sp.]|nr:nucleoside deaminase [Salinibacterium sp.]
MQRMTDQEHLGEAVELARLARAHGNHPFGALLVAADGTVVRAENTVLTSGDPTGHAETNLVRQSAMELSAEQLATSVLYTSTEPCAMCCGAIFWAGIGTVVYALSGEALIALLPPDSREFTLDLPSREVFARGGHAVEVRGPLGVPGTAEVHAGFWD